MQISWNDFIFDEVLGPILNVPETNGSKFNRNDDGLGSSSRIDEGKNRETSRNQRSARMVGQPTLNQGHETQIHSDMEVGGSEPESRLTKGEA